MCAKHIYAVVHGTSWPIRFRSIAGRIRVVRPFHPYDLLTRGIASSPFDSRLSEGDSNVLFLERQRRPCPDDRVCYGAEGTISARREKGERPRRAR